MVEDVRPSNSSTGIKHTSHRFKQIFLQVFVGMIILICGVIIGWGSAVLYMKDKMMMPPGPRPPTREVVEDMSARYDLTPEQAKQVEAAFGKRRESLQTLFEQFRTKSESEFQKLSADIKNILTPEQYECWEQDFKRRRRPEPWKRGPGRPGDRGPGPRGPGPRGLGPKGPNDRDPGRDFEDRSHSKGFDEIGPGPMKPGPRESFEEMADSNSVRIGDPNSNNGE
jgi:Spy/CpxP family protein refolding chaperone